MLPRMKVKRLALFLMAAKYAFIYAHSFLLFLCSLAIKEILTTGNIFYRLQESIALATKRTEDSVKALLDLAPDAAESVQGVGDVQRAAVDRERGGPIAKTERGQRLTCPLSLHGRTNLGKQGSLLRPHRLPCLPQGCLGGGDIRVYYGAADTSVCAADMAIDDVLSALDPV